MSCRTSCKFLKPSLCSFAVFVTVVALAFTAPAQVAPATIFELDGNSFPESTINCDWDTLNGGKTQNSTTPTANCSYNAVGPGGYGFLVGAPGEPAFTTGGSKDSNDVSKWLWAITSTPDKDTLTHGYGASYVANSGGDKILVFGAERFAVNGDSNIGIWFFQQNVGISGGPSKGGFSGLHTPGDILIVSAFSGGGGTSTISVYQWAPTGSPIPCPNSNYPNITTTGQLSPPVCAATNLLALFYDQSVAEASTSNAFAIVNSGPITIGWPYASKFGGNNNVVPTGGFYEGGIDLTSLLPSGENAPCFSSFLFETRSSQSTSAVLKDFLVGSFPQCHVSVNKTYTCGSFNPDGSYNYSYIGNVINDGGGDLFNVQVTDTPVGSTTPVTYSCGNLPRGTGAPPSLTFPSTSCPQPTGTFNTFTTTNHPANNVANASACTTPLSGGNCTSTVITNTTGSVQSTDAGNCTPSPKLMVAKRCVTAFQAGTSDVFVRVDYTGEVQNTGTVNLNSVYVTDDVDSKIYGPFSLNVNQSVCYTSGAATCPALPVTYGLTTAAPAGAASYTPIDSANVFGLTAGRIQFTDTVKANGKDPQGGRVPLSSADDPTASASCLICPGGSCPAP